MPLETRRIEARDLIPNEVFAKERAARRADLLPIKRRRRVELGPHCTFYFENYETMLFQVQEMLLIERGGDEQIADELTAYNPLVPQGDELCATVMFEIDDPRRRAAILGRLGGVEELFYIQIGAEKVIGAPTDDVERSRADGKTSSVHFLHFRFTAEQKARFRDPKVQMMIGCDHELYAHMAILSPATRAELASDLA